VARRRHDVKAANAREHRRDVLFTTVKRGALGCWLQLPALGAEAPDANTRVAYVKMAQLWLECAYQIEFKSVNIPARVARNARASDCRPRAKVQDSSLKLV